MARIAIVHSVAEMGGAERMSQVILLDEAHSPHSFYLVTPEQGPLVDSLQQSHTTCIELPMQQPSVKGLLSYLQQGMQWIRFFKQHHIDAIHTADPFCTRAVIPFCKLAGVKVITHFHFPFSYEVLKWAYQRFAPDVAVFCSRELQQSTGTLLQQISPSTQQEVIHNGVDEQRFNNAINTPNLQRPVIGIIANLQERKGHDDFIAMAKQLHEQGVKASYMVVGGDILATPRMEGLKAQVADYGLSDAFTFTGQVDNVMTYLTRLDIYVCASHQEAFPVSILEAMAAQKVIVSTNINGIPEALNQQNSLLVDAHSPQQLCAAVQNILADRDAALTRAAQARQDVVEHFTLGTYLQKWRNVYSKI